jgi:hypothetical protein
MKIGGKTCGFYPVDKPKLRWNVLEKAHQNAVIYNQQLNRLRATPAGQAVENSVGDR